MSFYAMHFGIVCVCNIVTKTQICMKLVLIRKQQEVDMSFWNTVLRFFFHLFGRKWNWNKLCALCRTKDKKISRAVISRIYQLLFQARFVIAETLIALHTHRQIQMKLYECFSFIHSISDRKISCKFKANDAEDVYESKMGKWKVE